MGNKILLAALLSATALTAATPAFAQDTADVAAELAAMRAKIDSLEGEVAALKAAAPAPAEASATQVTWKGALGEVQLELIVEPTGNRARDT